MPVKRGLFAGFALGQAALSGCGPGSASAPAAFHDGRLPAAAAELRALEPAARAAGSRTLPRYARLRGLVELGLGNVKTADVWLSLAKRAAESDARLFDAEEKGELDAAWRSMGRMPGDRGSR